MSRDLYSELLADDLPELLGEDEELGSLFGGILKGIGKVARSALKIVKIVPGIGSIAAAADMGLDVAEAVGKGLGGKKKKGQAAQTPAAQRASPTARRVASQSVRSARGDVSPNTAPRMSRAADGGGVSVGITPIDLDAVVAQFRAGVAPQLNAVANTLAQMNVQAQVTNEHRARLRTNAFRKAVLARRGR